MQIPVLWKVIPPLLWKTSFLGILLSENEIPVCILLSVTVPSSGIPSGDRPRVCEG